MEERELADRLLQGLWDQQDKNDLYVGQKDPLGYVYVNGRVDLRALARTVQAVAK